MSLRARITILTITVTAIIVIALFMLQLHNVIATWTNSSLEIAHVAGEQIKHVLIMRLEERTPAVAAGGNGLSSEEQAWTTLLQSDRNFASLLEETMAQAHAIIEISIAGANGTVITSSNPMRRGEPLKRVRGLDDLRRLNVFLRAWRILEGENDYDLRIPLGLRGQAKPVLTIQVLVSSILLRGDLKSAMRRVSEWGAAALLASLLLAFGSATLAVSNLSRLGRVIDRISRGEETVSTDPEPPPSPEFAAIESKLNMLGHQVRGAREHEAQIRGNVEKLLEGLEEAILLFDADERLLLCGGAAESKLGLSNSLAGQPLSRVLPAETQLGLVAREALKQHRGIKDRPVDWRSGGNVAHLLVTIEFLPDPRARAAFAVLMRVRDASGHQRLESELSLSARLEAMHRITSSVAHEIKNPLNSISARLDYLQSWATDEFPEAETEIQSIFEEVNRLDRVVRSFLDFTRPVELAHERVNLVAVASDIAHLLKTDAAARGVSVRFSSNTSEAVVQGDEDLLKEAILNLATNGIEAMPHGGDLEIGVAQDDRHCRVTIRDTGVGIPEAQRDKVFQLYFTTKKHGSGLGLPMAYRAVELHGGRLQLQSEPGKGTCFSLDLPIMEVGAFR